jgi:ABC-type uncharacterized transport system permease subunit
MVAQFQVIRRTLCIPDMADIILGIIQDIDLIVHCTIRAHTIMARILSIIMDSQIMEACTMGIAAAAGDTAVGTAGMVAVGTAGMAVVALRCVFANIFPTM